MTNEEESNIFLVDKLPGKTWIEKYRNLKKLIDENDSLSGDEKFSEDEIKILKYVLKALQDLSMYERKNELELPTDEILDYREIEQLLVDLGYDHMTHVGIFKVEGRALKKLKSAFAAKGLSYDDLKVMKKKH